MIRLKSDLNSLQEMLGVLILALLAICDFRGMSGSEALCLGVSSCSCEVIPKGLIANCRNQKLDRVPAFQTEALDLVYYELTLHSNNIHTIEENAFSGIRVKRLVLTNNPIKSISDNAFSGLESDLREMLLQIDKSAVFPTAALSKLPMLENLEIVGYGFDALPSNALTSFSKLRSLSLTLGGLRSLTPTDLSLQKSQLSYLNLHSNEFREIPTAALKILSNLTELHMDLNQIATVGSSAFEGVLNLLVLDLSRNPIIHMNLGAFAGLENKLHNLSLHQCGLSNEHLKAIIPLVSLTYLEISYNSLVSVDEILRNMNFLQVLKAARNQISSLKKTSYQSMSNSLRILHLDENPLVDVESDTFVDLTSLQELYLDGAQKLSLDANSFVSQRSSLHLLSLRSASLNNGTWPAVSQLSAVRTLWMSSCGLIEVPNDVFHQMHQLENLDLNNNAITQISQRSLSGLSNSLVRLYLSGNKLRTLNECVFYKFKKLDLLQLQLNNNPLECDCGMKWLHDRLQPYKSDPATLFRVMALQWKCANLNGKLFTTLEDTDFDSCSTVTTAIQCEEVEIVTPSVGPNVTAAPSSTPSMDGSLVLRLTEVTHNSITAVWTIPVLGVVTGFTLTYMVDGRPVSVSKLHPRTTQYQLTGLTPQTQYIVCLDMSRFDVPAETTCSNATTAASPEPRILPIIIGTSVAAAGCVILSVIAIITIRISVRKSRQSKPQLVRQPTVGRQSKRYRKTKDVDLSPTEVGTTPDEALIHTLVTMTDEEKDRMVSLLTSSMHSLDDVDRKSSFNYITGRYGRMDPVALYSVYSRDKHEYDEIPDSYYDEAKQGQETTEGGETLRTEGSEEMAKH